ncbi:MAG: hypothetical protein Ta2C_11050 [Candidatus Endomicrobiellum trichonymphae]|uniref:replication initiation protein n=1 Tax=Endomicrobium trichonymphae TaxID=1408204 RepID=UPI0027D44048|nr:MAG: hypothetical protein Ta2C_11050 [Candidatus Endomicrobium trichonymphae]
MSDENLRNESDLILHPRHLAQGCYIMSVTANRLLKIAMSLFDPNSPDKRTVKFKFSDYFKCYNLPMNGTNSKDNFKAACKELRKAGIDLMTDYEYGFSYLGVNFTEKVKADYTPEKDEVFIKFTEEIAIIFSEYKKIGYDYLKMENFGKLQGKYDQRFYEIAMSRCGFKDDNDEWYFEYSIDQLRELLDAENIYTTTNDFRKYIIDRSIIAINEADIGLEISTDYKSQKRKYLKKNDPIHFFCKLVSQKNPKSVQPKTQTEADRNINPELWETCLLIAKRDPEYQRKSKFLSNEWNEIDLQNRADKLYISKLQEIKKKKNQLQEKDQLTNTSKVNSRLHKETENLNDAIDETTILDNVKQTTIKTGKHGGDKIGDFVFQIVNEIKRVANKSDAFKEMALDNIRENELSEALALNIAQDDIFDALAVATKEAPEEMRKLVKKLIFETPIGNFESISELGKDFKKTIKNNKIDIAKKTVKAVAVQLLFVCIAGIIAFFAGTTNDLSSLLATPSLLLLLLI